MIEPAGGGRRAEEKGWGRMGVLAAWLVTQLLKELRGEKLGVQGPPGLAGEFNLKVKM